MSLSTKSSRQTSSSSSKTRASNELPKPYGTATVDYSAANEYLDEQYEDKIPNPYFPHDQATERIYDGRSEDPTLESRGFQLTPMATPDVRDWNNKEQLRAEYLPILRDFFTRTYGEENIKHLFFYNPMARGEEMGVSQSDLESHELPSSPTQTRCHLDNDWSASNLDRVVGLVHKQTLDYYDNKDGFPRQELERAIQEGHRYMVINCWRNTDPHHVIQRAPLGVYATQYADSRRVFPLSRPDFDRSRWYVFPHMTADECLMFKQFDRDDRYIGDIWHCALHSLRVPEEQDEDDDNRDSKPPRRSFDVRAFLVLKDKVDSDHDRYGPNRLEPKYKTAQEHQDATSWSYNVNWSEGVSNVT